MNIEVTAKSTYEIFRKYLKFNFFSNKFQFYTMIFLYIILIPFFIIYSVLYVKYLGYDFLIISSSVIVLFISIWVPFNVFVRPIINYKKKVKDSDDVQNYKFTENEVIVLATTQDIKLDCSLKYNSFIKIAEANEFFYLYLKKNTAIIIPKSCFNVGTPEELKNFFKQNIDNKKLKLLK